MWQVFGSEGRVGGKFTLLSEIGGWWNKSWARGSAQPESPGDHERTAGYGSSTGPGFKAASKPCFRIWKYDLLWCHISFKLKLKALYDASFLDMIHVMYFGPVSLSGGSIPGRLDLRQRLVEVGGDRPPRNVCRGHERDPRTVGGSFERHV